MVDSRTAASVDAPENRTAWGRERVEDLRGKRAAHGTRQEK